MPGLFDMPSPDEIRQQMAARLGQQSIARRSGPATAGAGIGKLLGALIAGKPPALEQAEQREKLLKHVASEQGVSFKDDPVGAMREGAELARKAGDMKLAMSFMDKAFTYESSIAKTKGKGIGKGATKLEKLENYFSRQEEGTPQWRRAKQAVIKEATRARSGIEEVSKIIDNIQADRRAKGLPPVTSEKEFVQAGYGKEYLRMKAVQRTSGIPEAIRNSLSGYEDRPKPTKLR